MVHIFESTPRNLPTPTTCIFKKKNPEIMISHTLSKTLVIATLIKRIKICPHVSKHIFWGQRPYFSSMKYFHRIHDDLYVVLNIKF